MQVERLHVLVLNLHVVIVSQIRGQRCKAERVVKARKKTIKEET